MATKFEMCPQTHIRVIQHQLQLWNLIGALKLESDPTFCTFRRVWSPAFNNNIHDPTQCTIMILIIRTIQLFEHPPFQEKYCISSIRTPTFEIIIPISEHLHLVELEQGR